MKPTRPTWLLASLWLALSTLALAAASPAYISAALNDPARAKDAEADARRHPAELVAFAQIKPGATVVDLIPGGGYFTRIFSQVVGAQGHVYAIVPDEYAKEDADELALMQALVKDPHYSNVTLLRQPAAQLSIPGKADVV